MAIETDGNISLKEFDQQLTKLKLAAQNCLLTKSRPEKLVAAQSAFDARRVFNRIKRRSTLRAA